jgi:hypothetical protein
MKTINYQIREQATGSTQWRYKAQAQQAYEALEKINIHLFESKLPDAVLGFGALNGRLKMDGAYHWEGDNISLNHHIDLKPNLTRLELVIALIHNAAHMQAETYSVSTKSKSKTGWYHKKIFRSLMLSFGIKTAPNGDTAEIAGAFSATLEKLGLEELIPDIALWERDMAVEPVGDCENAPSPDAPIPTIEAKATKAKATKAKATATKGTASCTFNGEPTRLWQCGCMSIEALANIEVDAVCCICSSPFVGASIDTVQEVDDDTVNLSPQMAVISELFSGIDKVVVL